MEEKKKYYKEGEKKADEAKKKYYYREGEKKAD